MTIYIVLFEGNFYLFTRIIQEQKIIKFENILFVLRQVRDENRGIIVFNAMLIYLPYRVLKPFPQKLITIVVFFHFYKFYHSAIKNIIYRLKVRNIL